APYLLTYLLTYLCGRPRPGAQGARADWTDWCRRALRDRRWAGAGEPRRPWRDRRPARPPRRRPGDQRAGRDDWSGPPPRAGWTGQGGAASRDRYLGHRGVGVEGAAQRPVGDQVPEQVVFLLGGDQPAGPRLAENRESQRRRRGAQAFWIGHPAPVVRQQSSRRPAGHPDHLA